jgi:hypothetical protein
MVHLIDFFNSSFFIAITTIGTAFVAWLVYQAKIKGDKIQAARVLITEIRIAEERIDQMRNKMNDEVPSDLPLIFPTKSWKKYSHLFISDFDQDELKLLNAFYDYGELTEEYAKRDNDFFWVATEERAKVTVQKIAEFACEAIAGAVVNKDQFVQNKRNDLSSLLDRNNALYSPSKSVNVIKKILPNIPKITTSSCGLKLKKLAKLEI